MEPSDLTIRVLTDIRDEIRGMRGEVRATNERVDHLEVHLSRELAEVATTNRQIVTLLRDRFDLRDRVERCERDIAELKQRL